MCGGNRVAFMARLKRVKPSEKSPECGKEFIDYGKYRVEVKLKQHILDKHGQTVVCEKVDYRLKRG
jgi:hypothetical protein